MKPYFESENGVIHLGDCLAVLREMPENSIDLTVTSPPYDSLRKYKGYTFDFEGIAQQLYRVTKPGGVVVWVVGDETVNGSESGTSFRQTLYFKDFCGFNLHDTMIYRSSKPPLTHNRYEQEFEYMFVFSKGKINKFNPIKERCRSSGQRSGGTIRQTGADLMPKHKRGPVKIFKHKGNIWKYKTGINGSTIDKIAFKHPAIFPEALARDHIISWSNKGDTVLDPMCGSGTTLKMAEIYGRKWIGIEIAEEYAAIAANRIRLETQQQKLPGF